MVWFIFKKCLHQPVCFFNLFQGVSHLSRLESGKQPRDEAQRPCLMHVLIYDLQVDYGSKQKRAKAVNILKGVPHRSTVSEEELAAKNWIALAWIIRLLLTGTWGCEYDSPVALHGVMAGPVPQTMPEIGCLHARAAWRCCVTWWCCDWQR